MLSYLRSPWSSLSLLLVAIMAVPAHALCTGGTGGVLNQYLLESTPTADFRVDSPGTITHTKTGLMWRRCAEGQNLVAVKTGTGSQCSGTAWSGSWTQAIQATANANNQYQAAYTDWRLPNKKELESIVETCGRNPASNQTIFPNTPLYYFWSGTTYTPIQSNAWVVNFVDGGSSWLPMSSSGYYVRLVRGGSTVDAFDPLHPAANPSVIYNGNGNSGGSVPTDAHAYSEGVVVAALGNSGNLVKAGSKFIGWNTAADASGTTYPVGASFTMGAQQFALYALWQALPSDSVVLKDLVISDGNLSPVFNGNTLIYADSVPYAVKSVSVKPTATYGDAAITVNGKPVTSASSSDLIDLVVGSKNRIDVVLTAPDGSTSQTYLIGITRQGAAPDLTLAMSHGGNFVKGQSYAPYTIVVSNVGELATDGTKVGVSITLPAGLTATALSGSGWNCVLSAIVRSCTRTDVLPNGASYPTITLAVGVANNAAASLISTARVSGGGDVNSANNLVNDATRIVSNLTSILMLLLD